MKIKFSTGKMIVLLILFLLSNRLIISETTQSADNYLFRQITIKEGLSQSSILAILQDQEGFMWFGTGNGLNKYDGYNFTVYLNDPYDSTSISDNEITSIYEDKDGYIWIGTISGILNKFDRTTETLNTLSLNMIKILNPSLMKVIQVTLLPLSGIMIIQLPQSAEMEMVTYGLEHGATVYSNLIKKRTTQNIFTIILQTIIV